MARYKRDPKTGERTLVEPDTAPHPRPKPRRPDGRSYASLEREAAKPNARRKRGSKS